MNQKYSAPLNKLLTYGSCLPFKEWPNYLELGFSKKDIDGLIKMVLDEDLYHGIYNNDERWAAVHAWRTLGQLKAISAAAALLKLLYRDENEFDEWIGEEIPKVFKMLGPDTIPVIQKYIKENDANVSANITTVSCLELIGNKYPESRDKCIEILSDELKICERFDSEYNGFLILYLVELKAIEALDIIKEAFEKEVVSLSIMGDFESVEIDLGLRTKRSTPLPEFGFFKEKSPYEDYNQFDEHQTTRTSSKIGRNEPCPCGSKKKYKKCCIVR